MLCIVYISKAKTTLPGSAMPTLLPGILANGRANNAAHGISTVLVCKNGMYLQLIEGEPDDVDQLYKNICNDDRHEEIEKIIDVPVQERSFADTDMSMILDINEDPRVVNFIANNKEFFQSSINDIDEKLKLFGCDNLQTLAPILTDQDESYFADKSFLIKDDVDIDWLNQGILNPEIAMAGMSLSDTLYRNTRSFKELCKSKVYGSRETLVYLLNTLNSSGYLLLTETSLHNNKSNNGGLHHDKQSFGQKLLSWLGKH